MYPVKGKKFPQNQLDPRLLEKYDLWKESGEPLEWDKSAER